MIIYDFICQKEHVFEGWFKDYQLMNEQLKKGLVTYPVCESNKISIKPSSIGIATKKEEPQRSNKKQNVYHFYNAVKDYIDRNFEDVGAKFDEEAVPFFKLNLPKFDT